jgi:hypothetical protein
MYHQKISFGSLTYIASRISLRLRFDGISGYCVTRNSTIAWVRLTKKRQLAARGIGIYLVIGFARSSAEVTEQSEGRLFRRTFRVMAGWDVGATGSILR